MTINDQTLEDLAEMREEVQAVIDTRAQEIDAGWRDAWATVEEGWLVVALVLASAGGEVRRRIGKRVLRDPEVAAQIDKTVSLLDDLEELQPNRATIAAVVSSTVTGQESMIAAQLPNRTVVVSAPAASLDALRQRTRQQMLTRWSTTPAAVRSSISTSLIRGFVGGDNPRDVARKLVSNVGGAFALGRHRALTIARTELLDAHREGARVVDVANADVLAGWQHVATLDTRTCASCLALHGSVHPVEEAGPLDHQQGRCARVPLVRPWADLGFPGVEEPPATLPDARAWFADLPQEQRLAIMGPTRLDLLDSGAVSWDDLATRRSTPGWRDSYVPTPVRDLVPAQESRRNRKRPRRGRVLVRGV